MKLLDSCVSVGLVVDHGDPVPGTGENERCGEPGSPAADHEDIRRSVPRDRGAFPATVFMTLTPESTGLPRAA
jgi:hypothetical protein